MILVSVPLLDTGSVFEEFKLINLPIPYPDTKQGVGIIAQNKIESENIAFNLARTEFMLLNQQNAEKCGIGVLGTWISSSPIYVASNQDLGILELFRDNKKGAKKMARWRYWLTLNRQKPLV